MYEQFGDQTGKIYVFDLRTTGANVFAEHRSPRFAARSFLTVTLSCGEPRGLRTEAVRRDAWLGYTSVICALELESFTSTKRRGLGVNQL